MHPDSSPLSAASRTLSAFTAFGGYLVLSWAYASALLWPSDHALFIQKTAGALYFFEFFSIHSSGFFFHPGGEFRRQWKGIALIGFYSIFALAFSVVFHDRWLFLYFFLSLFSKFASTKVSEKDYRKTMITIIPFIGWTFFCMVFTAWLWALLFPFPPDNSTPQWVGGPQSVLVWGALYFVTLAVMEIHTILFSKPAGVRLKQTNLEI
ncbi:hypothetical protein HZA86_04590 [Candidatus Uhrbacteria bacterium]|nr:hypothetical protein [Candidatus Uhrbacteria bacterium]